MKIIIPILMLALFAFSAIPMVIAEEVGVNPGVNLTIDPNNSCPVVLQDITQRSWYPNDQTIYTAAEYGTCDTNLYEDKFCEVSERGSYVFTGETLAFYVVIEDMDGVNDIGNVVLNGFGSCVDKAVPTDEIISLYTYNDTPNYTNWEDYAQAKFGINSWNPSIMKLYKCKLIVGSETGEQQLIIKVEDKGDTGCNSTHVEDITFNPSINVSIDDSINFGTVVAGSTATASPITLNNNGGVVLDMYIASDDYFKDPINKNTICGDEGNGIKYDRFSYYAVKGTVNSGSNDNNWSGIGYFGLDKCQARNDSNTVMPSYSGSVGDMCRIINNLREGSFLVPGDSMSITFSVDVPLPCRGSFTQGHFHFIGRVV